MMHTTFPHPLIDRWVIAISYPRGAPWPEYVGLILATTETGVLIQTYLSGLHQKPCYQRWVSWATVEAQWRIFECRTEMEQGYTDALSDARAIEKVREGPSN